MSERKKVRERERERERERGRWSCIYPKPPSLA